MFDVVRKAFGFWLQVGLTSMTLDDCASNMSSALFLRNAVRGQTETRSFLHKASPSLDADGGQPGNIRRPCGGAHLRH